MSDSAPPLSPTAPQDAETAASPARPEPTDQGEADALQRLLASLPGAGVRVQLWRYESNGERAFLDTVDGEVFDPAWVRDNYGGGKYQARCVDGTGTFIPGASTFRISGPPIEPARPKRAADPEDEPAWARRLEDRLERLEGRGATDPVQSAVQLATTMTSALMGSITPMIDRLGEQGGPSYADLLALVREGVELGRESKGDAGYAPVIERLGVPLMDIIRHEAAARGLGGGAPAPGPGAPRPNPAGSPSGTPRPPWAAHMEPHVPGLVQLAAVHSDPEWVAQVVVLDRLDDVGGAFLAEELVRADFTRDLFGQFPELAPHREWVRDLVEALREELEDADAEDVGEDPAGG